MTLPFDGAISAFYETEAPESVREAIRKADKDDILSPDYPYREEMGRKAYEDEIEALQLQLVRLQANRLFRKGDVAARLGHVAMAIDPDILLIKPFVVPGHWGRSQESESRTQKNTTMLCSLSFF